MNRIKEIWSKLEKDAAHVNGMFKIRYSDSSGCDLYLALKTPENTHCLFLGLPLVMVEKINIHQSLRGLKFEKLADPGHKERAFLGLILLNNRFSDIFDSLLLDIIINIINLSDEAVIAREFLNRIDKWQALFEKASSEGLSAEAQRGLFGELFFLRKWLEVTDDKEKCLTAWVGPELMVKDFQLHSWALEVKTTKGNNHQKIHISSERQLDNTTLDWLFLFHLSLDIQLGSGETLTGIVNSVYTLLNHESHLVSHFQKKLLAAGFFQVHTALYDAPGYHIRDMAYYEVKGDFPRIQEKEVRDGVGDIKYTIIINTCRPYEVSEHVVLSILKG